MIKLSDYVVRFFELKGMKHVFMLPGGGAMHLDDSIGKSGINYICFLHEQAAAIAAEAYGQHTNKPGLVFVTSGPGATNAITGVTAGWLDSTPMFIISGQAKRKDLVGDKGVRQTGSQEVPIIDMVQPITKYAVQVLEPTKIKYYLERGYYEAMTGRPGPVWLDIPLDVQAAMVEENGLEGFCHKKRELQDFSEIVQKTIELLKKAERPLVLVGNGVKLAGAQSQLAELVKTQILPVETTWKTIDMFAEENECYVGHPGIMGDRGANWILQNADVILSIGCRMDTSVTAFNERNFGKRAKKIVIDIDPNEIARMDMDITASMSCDAKEYLCALLKELTIDSDMEKKRQQRRDWLAKCKRIRKKYPVVTEKHRNQKEYVSAYYFIELLCQLLKEDDIIVPESSGGAGEITYQAFRVKKGQKIKNAAALGAMGFGLPYAIGSCIANGKKRTILINGDGGFQLNIQELETLHRLNLPIKIFIWNNNGYGSIRTMQNNNFQGHLVACDSSSGLTLPQIRKVAGAYGFQTCGIYNNQELSHTLPQILSDNSPILCEIQIAPEETIAPRVKTVVGENGTIMSGFLENMWPYLKEGEEIV